MSERHYITTPKNLLFENQPRPSSVNERSQPSTATTVNDSLDELFAVELDSIGRRSTDGELFHNHHDSVEPHARNHKRLSLPQDSGDSSDPHDGNDTKRKSQNDRYESLINRYALQQTVRDLLPGSRCAKCRRNVVPSKHYVTFCRGTGGKAYVGNLQMCGSVWVCPICAPIITEQRKAELNEALYIKAPQLGLYPVMVTLTLSHHFNDRLRDLLDILCGARVEVPGRKTKKEIPGARNYFLAGSGWASIAKKYGVAGWIHNLEILYSTRGNGWHPHIHMILMLDRPLNKQSQARFQAALRRRWLPALRRAGKNFGKTITAGWEHGCKVTTDAGNIAEYVAKYGKLPANTWTVATEITKAQMKHRTEGFNIWELEALAGDGVEYAQNLVKAYYFATKGRKQLQWSQNLRKKLNVAEVSDEAAAAIAEDTAEDRQVEALMDSENWKIVCYAKQRGEAQRAFELGGFAGLSSFVAKLGAEAIEVKGDKDNGKTTDEGNSETLATEIQERKKTEPETQGKIGDRDVYSVYSGTSPDGAPGISPSKVGSDIEVASRIQDLQTQNGSPSHEPRKLTYIRQRIDLSQWHLTGQISITKVDQWTVKQ